MTRLLTTVGALTFAAVVAWTGPVEAAPTATPGWYDAPKAQVTKLTKALKSNNQWPDGGREVWWADVPARCLDVDQPNSSRQWFMYYPKCRPWNEIDSSERLVKLLPKGRLVFVAYGQFYRNSCQDMANKVRQAGGPISVVKDLKAGVSISGGRWPLCGNN